MPTNTTAAGLTTSTLGVRNPPLPLLQLVNLPLLLYKLRKQHPLFPQLPQHKMLLPKLHQCPTLPTFPLERQEPRTTFLSNL